MPLWHVGERSRSCATTYARPVPTRGHYNLLAGRGGGFVSHQGSYTVGAAAAPPSSHTTCPCPRTPRRGSRRTPARVERRTWCDKEYHVEPAVPCRCNVELVEPDVRETVRSVVWVAFRAACAQGALAVPPGDYYPPKAGPEGVPVINDTCSTRGGVLRRWV